MWAIREYVGFGLFLAIRAIRENVAIREYVRSGLFFSDSSDLRKYSDSRIAIREILAIWEFEQFLGNFEQILKVVAFRNIIKILRFRAYFEENQTTRFQLRSCSLWNTV